eukprot:13602500-Alexandrium_andersonii.AAC.1
MGTDQGGDQKASEVYMEADFDDSPRDLKIRQWCFQHQAHLTVRKQVKRTGGGTYFADVARAVNVWRAGSNPRKLHAAWESLCSTARADAVCK